MPSTDEALLKSHYLFDAPQLICPDCRNLISLRPVNMLAHIVIYKSNGTCVCGREWVVNIPKVTASYREIEDAKHC